MPSVCRATERTKQRYLTAVTVSTATTTTTTTKETDDRNPVRLLAFTEANCSCIEETMGHWIRCVSRVPRCLSLSVSRVRNLVILVDAVVGMSGQSCLSDKRCRNDDRQQEGLVKNGSDPRNGRQNASRGKHSSVTIDHTHAHLVEKTSR